MRQIFGAGFGPFPGGFSFSGTISNGTPKNLRDLLAELAILSHRVAGSAQPSSDDLFAEQLRHERSEPDHVGDGVAVPPFRQHPHADDAAHVPAGRMEGPFELPYQRLEPFRVEGSTLPVPRPVGLPDGVERQTHPPVGVGFRFPAVGFAHHLGVHTDGADVCVDVAQFVETRRRNPHRRVVFGEPSIDDLGERGVLANDDEYGRAALVLALFPFLAQRIPEPAEHGEWHMCVLEHRLRLRPGEPAATFRGRQLGQNPAPDVEVAGNGAAAGIANRELRNLHQAGFDCVDKPEVTHHPGEWPVGVLPHPAQIVGRSREVDA